MPDVAKFRHILIASLEKYAVLWIIICFPAFLLTRWVKELIHYKVDRSWYPSARPEHCECVDVSPWNSRHTYIEVSFSVPFFWVKTSGPGNCCPILAISTHYFARPYYHSSEHLLINGNCPKYHFCMIKILYILYKKVALPIKLKYAFLLSYKRLP